MEFQMNSTNLPFNQYTKVKLRDKGYQQLDEEFKSKLDINDFWSLFIKGKEKGVTDDDCIEPTEDEQRVLRQAYLLTKSVPRRSTRKKGKEESGYTPNLLHVVDSCNLFVGDLVGQAKSGKFCSIVGSFWKQVRVRFL